MVYCYVKLLLFNDDRDDHGGWGEMGALKGGGRRKQSNILHTLCVTQINFA